MELKLIDLEALTQFKESIYHLTKHDFALYDVTGRLLVPPIVKDPIIEAFASSTMGRREHNSYLKGGIEKAALRKSPSPFKGPLNQYHYFIPAQVGDTGLVLVGNAFYLALKDLDDFFVSKGQSYGLSKEDMRFWARKIVTTDISSVSDRSEDIQRLFALVVRESFLKNMNGERYRTTITIMELFSEIEEDISEEKLYHLLTDAIIFLFGGDTVSIFLRDRDAFVPVLTAGRQTEQVKSIRLRGDNAIIAEIVRNRKPFVSAETVELLRLGYSDEVASMYLFPLSVGKETFGLLSVLNSHFSPEDMESISRLCGFTAFLLRTVIAQKVVGTKVDGLTAMNLALNLSPAFENPDMLYESIVEISSKLLNAEKASLMLLEEERRELLIKAVKGINKWIAKNIRVKVGEGIAGKVCKEGRPLIVSDMERNLSTQRKPNYRTESFMSIPLKIGDETIGVLNIADKAGGEVFSEADAEFIRYFASYASIAIKGAHYYSMSEEMRTLSITDPLTGLFNRRYFDNRVFEELQRGIRYESVSSLAIFDIDDFKLFNDTEGHVAGDEILKAIAHISRESLRSIDIIARFGGEEFVIIMPQTDKDEAFLVAERVRKNIKELIPKSWKKFPREKITVSMGIASFPADGKDVKALIKNTDRALYQAKVSGKDRTVIWGSKNPSLHETSFHDAV
jgi:diguanylate cyclase (GGDEF)-like protein